MHLKTSHSRDIPPGITILQEWEGNSMDKKKLHDALSKALEEKGKRKFKQSLELIINVRSVDFSKTDNRLNLDIVLPKGKGGKEPRVGVIGDEGTVSEAKKNGADLTILPDQLPTYAEASKLKELEQYALLAQPPLMSQVARYLGQYLGPRGKLPRPIVGSLAPLINRTKHSVRIVSKGKYLPVVQCFVGTEDMPVEDLTENIEVVYDAVKNKVSEGNIKSVYVKLSMGKPARVI